MTGSRERRLTLTHVTVFYGLMGGIAAAVGLLLFDEIPIRVRADVWDPAPKAALGAVMGLLVVGFSRFSSARFEWAKRLEGNFRSLLGKISIGAAGWMALTSALAEELLFRGLALRLFLPSSGEWTPERVVIAVIVTSLIFGLLHVGPDKSYRPWTAFALVLGIAFGAATVWTGDIVAVVIAHMTINYFNFLAIAGEPD